MMEELKQQTRRMVAEQLGNLMLTNIELSAQLQATMQELGKAKSEASAKGGKAPKPNGKAHRDGAVA